MPFCFIAHINVIMGWNKLFSRWRASYKSKFSAKCLQHMALINLPLRVLCGVSFVELRVWSVIHLYHWCFVCTILFYIILGMYCASLNSLAPKRWGSNFTSAFFKLILQMDISGASCESHLRRVPQYSIDGKSTLVQVMAWCRQATSHDLSQHGPRSMTNGTTRPQWVNPITQDPNPSSIRLYLPPRCPPR